MDQESAAILKAAGVCLRQFSPPRNGLIYLQNSQNIASDLPLIISLSGGNDIL
jgi:dCMP deaminase